jgi:hypothetical protein
MTIILRPVYTDMSVMTINAGTGKTLADRIFEKMFEDEFDLKMPSFVEKVNCFLDEVRDLGNSVEKVQELWQKYKLAEDTDYLVEIEW